MALLLCCATILVGVLDVYTVSSNRILGGGVTFCGCVVCFTRWMGEAFTTVFGVAGDGEFGISGVLVVVVMWQ
jgi:hypothetical protein